MDLINNLDAQLTVPLQSSGAAVVSGTAVDVSLYKDVLGIVSVGTIDASTTVNAKLQESDDGSAWSDVAGEAIEELGADDDDQIATKLKYRRHAGSAKKYARINVTVAGSGNALIAAHLIAGNPVQAPVS
jgi:hypothetical protein